MRNRTGLYRYVYNETEDNLYLIDAINSVVNSLKKIGQSKKLEWAGRTFTIRFASVVELDAPVNDGFCYYEDSMKMYDIQG